MELWKEISFFCSYEVSNFGKVRRSVKGKTRPAGHTFKPSVSNGYMRVCLTNGAIKKSMFVHRLVMASFVGPLPSGQEVAHIDGNPKNNSLNNLKYVSARENAADKRKHGTHPSGMKNGNSVLSDSDIIFIRKNYRFYSKTHGTVALAKKFGVTDVCIGNVVNRKSWALL